MEQGSEFSEAARRVAGPLAQLAQRAHKAANSLIQQQRHYDKMNSLPCPIGPHGDQCWQESRNELGWHVPNAWMEPSQLIPDELPQLIFGHIFRFELEIERFGTRFVVHIVQRQ